MLRRAAELGLLPAPDAQAGRWPAARAGEILGCWQQTAPKAGAGLGDVRCAGLLARLTGLPIRAGHVDALAARGLLAPSRLYHRRPMYRVADIEARPLAPYRALPGSLATGEHGPP